MEIDLHGLTHQEAIKEVEDWIFSNFRIPLFSGKIITGNSPALQNKIIKEVLDPFGMAYMIPKYNLGCILVGADVGLVLL